MKQKIIAFHLDEVDDWVVDLECGHTQHVRHKPPFQNRPWVINEKSRQSHIGFKLDCIICDNSD